MNHLPPIPYIDENQSSIVFDMIHRYQSGSPVILALDVGCGKTRMALACIQQLAYIYSQATFTVLLILPTTIRYQWIHEMRTTHMATEDAYCIYHDKNRTHKLDAFLNGSNASIRYVLSTAQTVRIDIEYLLSKNWDIVIIDEVHKLRNHETGSATAIRRFPCNKIGLTATPVVNKGYENVLSISYLLNERWGIDNKERFGDPATLDRESRSDTFSVSELSKCVVVTRTKQEFGLRTLSRKYEHVYVSFTDEERELYERVLEECKYKYKIYLSRRDDLYHYASEERRCLARQAMTDYQIALNSVRLRGIVPHLENDNSDNSLRNVPLSSKLRKAAAIIEKFHADKEPLLVFCYFKNPLQLLSNHLLFSHEMVTGKQSTKQRQNSIQRFVSGECNILLLTTGCGGIGLNLERAKHCLFLCAESNFQYEEQAIGRMDRRTQTSESITVMRICVPGTYDCIRHTVHKRQSAQLDQALRRRYNNEYLNQFRVYNTICSYSFHNLYNLQWLKLLQGDMNDDTLYERMYQIEKFYYHTRIDIDGHGQQEIEYQEENESYDTVLDDTMLWNAFLEDFNH